MSTSRPAPRPRPAVDPSHFEKGQVPRRAAHMEAAATGLRSAAGGDRRARDVMGWPSAVYSVATGSGINPQRSHQA
jgi:hypothetical protein